MSTTARIRASAAVICATLAVLIGAGLSVRGTLPTGDPATRSTTAAPQQVAAVTVPTEVDHDGGFESD
jgi:hypothetical protein